MRWLWRILVIVLLVGIFQSVRSEPQAFIKQENWVEKLKWEVRNWQRQVQDLPAAVEVEIRRLFSEFKPNGDGKSV